MKKPNQMSEEKLTQKQLVEKHLRSGKSITPAQAQRLYKCWRLSSVINRLRTDGMRIETKLHSATGHAIYSLKK